MQDPGFRPCIEPNCKGYFIIDDEASGQCQCYRDPSHRWCCNCQVNLTKSQHAGISCTQYQQWRRDNDTGDAAFEALMRKQLMDPDGTERMRRCPR
jgi:hypothetical protein